MIGSAELRVWETSQQTCILSLQDQCSVAFSPGYSKSRKVRKLWTVGYMRCFSLLVFVGFFVVSKQAEAAIVVCSAKGDGYNTSDRDRWAIGRTVNEARQVIGCPGSDGYHSFSVTIECESAGWFARVGAPGVGVGYACGYESAETAVVAAREECLNAKGPCYGDSMNLYAGYAGYDDGCPASNGRSQTRPWMFDEFNFNLTRTGQIVERRRTQFDYPDDAKQKGWCEAASSASAMSDQPSFITALYDGFELDRTDVPEYGGELVGQWLCSPDGSIAAKITRSSNSAVRQPVGIEIRQRGQPAKMDMVESGPFVRNDSFHMTFFWKPHGERMTRMVEWVYQIVQLDGGGFVLKTDEDIQLVSCRP